ncbi:MAG: ArsA family ATPase [Gemmatimonadaceae bacterium]
MTGLDRLLATLPAWVMVGGKGGVGKTTCAAALAIRASELGERTLLLSTDPARSLGEAIGESLSAAPTPMARHPGLHAMQLDAVYARNAFLTKWRDTLVTIVDRGTYLDREDIAGLVDAALPGADEAMALLSLLSLDSSGHWERMVIDTAPTGHTLRLLELPVTVRALAALLEAMQEKHRFMVRALTHRYHEDSADRFIRELQGEVDAIARRLRDAARTGVVLVTREEPVVAAESARYLSALQELGIPVFAIVTNAVVEDAESGEREAKGGAISKQIARQDGRTAGAGENSLMQAAASRITHFWVSELVPSPYGVEGIARWGAALRVGDFAISDEKKGWRARPRPGITSQRGGRPMPSLGRNLTIVGGKGGVGKTTVACGLAIATAVAERRVLLVSTDPAPSVADALALRIGDENTAVSEVPGLFARQMDASAGFARFRERYSGQVDDLFQSLLGRGVDAVHDRRIVRDLLALSPPGIDELYALAALGDMLEQKAFDAIIVDPAPTGHLLRLLEMPALALDWSHRLLRLMLKYKEVVPLGDAAQDRLAFAHRTRALGEMLIDSEQTGLLVVALDEPLVRGETTRLVSGVRSLAVPLAGILWNRATLHLQPLPAPRELPQFAAPVAAPSPRGVDAIRRWQAEWVMLPDQMK